jgi:hypothetical protein
VEESEAGAVELGEGVGGGVPVGENVCDPVPLVDAVAVDESDEEDDARPVLEGDAPSVSDAVGERLLDVDKDRDDDGVQVGVDEPVIVGL